MKISKVSLPPHCLVEKSFLFPSFNDAYAATVYSEQIPEPSDAVKIFFSSMNSFVRFLFLLREILAKLMGLKTINAEKLKMEINDFSGRVGDSVGLLIVLDKSEKELLTGQNDKHLDFRISFIINTRTNGFDLVIATTIKTKNNLGKLYLMIIKPFHKLVVPSIMKMMVKQFELR